MVLEALRRLEKDIHQAAQQVAMALHVDRLSRDPAFQAELRAAEEAAAAGFPNARPADDVMAELRAHLDRLNERPA